MKLKSISGGTHYRISDVDAGKLARGVNAKLPAWGREVRVQLPSGQLAWLRREHYTSRLYTDAPKRGWTWIVWDSNALTGNGRGAAASTDEADELKLYIDNDRDTYEKGRAYRDALAKRVQKGNFNLELAAKGFEWIVEEGAKHYKREMGTDQRFAPATRKLVAKEMAQDWLNEYRAEHGLKANRKRTSRRNAASSEIAIGQSVELLKHPKYWGLKGVVHARRLVDDGGEEGMRPFYQVVFFDPKGKSRSTWEPADRLRVLPKPNRKRTSRRPKRRTSRRAR